jgi:hypothetical protein
MITNETRFARPYCRQMPPGYVRYALNGSAAAPAKDDNVSGQPDAFTLSKPCLVGLDASNGKSASKAPCTERTQEDPALHDQGTPPEATPNRMIRVTARPNWPPTLGRRR